MKKCAKVENEIVTDVILAPDNVPASAFGPDYLEATNETQIGWTYSGGVYIAPIITDPTTLADWKVEAIKNLDLARAAILYDKMGNSSLAESMAFLIRALGCVAMDAGTQSAAQTQMVANESALTGQAQSAIVANTVSKFETYMADVGSITGIYKLAKNTINNATTKSDVRQAYLAAIAAFEGL